MGELLIFWRFDDFIFNVTRMSKFGGAPKCPRCGKSVYHAERATGPGGDWHKDCLVCIDCRKRLDSTTLAEHAGEAYCKSCHGKRFGPRGFGFAAGGATTMVSDPNQPRGPAKSPRANQGGGGAPARSPRGPGAGPAKSPRGVAGAPKSP